jgi:hypothetical protein
MTRECLTTSVTRGARQLREYIAQRSLYQLKEAEPHVWVIPRLRGEAKAAMAAVEYDEFGAGRGERVHAELFADLMAGLGLGPTYNGYLEAASAQMLAVVNLMSLLGPHRALCGALVGHFATSDALGAAAGDAAGGCGTSGCGSAGLARARM